MYTMFVAFLQAVTLTLCGRPETEGPPQHGPDAARINDDAVLPHELSRKSQLGGRGHYGTAYPSIRARRRQRCHGPPVDFSPLTWGVAVVFSDGVFKLVAFRLDKRFSGLYNIPSSSCDRAFLEQNQQSAGERSWLSWWFCPRQNESAISPYSGSPLLPALQACKTLHQVATLLRFSFRHHALATVWLPWTTVGGSDTTVLLVQARGDGSTAVWVVRWSPDPPTDPQPRIVGYRIIAPPKRRPERLPTLLPYAAFTPSVMLEQRVLSGSGEECSVLTYFTWWSVEVFILSPAALAFLQRSAPEDDDLALLSTEVSCSFDLLYGTVIDAADGPLALLAGNLEAFTSSELTPPSWLTAGPQSRHVYWLHGSVAAGVQVAVLLNMSSRQVMLASTGQAPMLMTYTAHSPLASLVDLLLSGAPVVDLSLLLANVASLLSNVNARVAPLPLTPASLLLPLSVPLVHPTRLLEPMAIDLQAFAPGVPPFPSRPLRFTLARSMLVVCVPRLPGLWLEHGLMAQRSAYLPTPLSLPAVPVSLPLQEAPPSSPKQQDTPSRAAMVVGALPARTARVVEASLPPLPTPTTAPVTKQPPLSRMAQSVAPKPVPLPIATPHLQQREWSAGSVNSNHEASRPVRLTRWEKEIPRVNYDTPASKLGAKLAMRAGLGDTPSPSRVSEKDDAPSTAATLPDLAASNNGAHLPLRNRTLQRRASTVRYPDMEAASEAAEQLEIESHRQSANNLEIPLRDTVVLSGQVENLVLSANQARRSFPPLWQFPPPLVIPPYPRPIPATSDSHSPPQQPLSETASPSSSLTSSPSPRSGAAHDEAPSQRTRSSRSSVSAAVSDSGSEIDEDLDPKDDGVRLSEGPMASAPLRRQDLFTSFTNPTSSPYTCDEFMTIARRTQLHKKLPAIAHDGELGSGGFSVVYKVGPSQGYDRVYALKVTHLGMVYEEKGWRLFRMLDLSKEACLLAKLSAVQPSVVVGQVAWGFGGPGDSLLLSLMELAEGGTLEDYRFNLPDTCAHYVFVALLHAIKVLHEQGINHYDLKPANILFLANGQLRLADLNIAVDINNLPSHDEKWGYTFGSDRFQAPERKEGLSLDVRGELYSVGKTMRAVAPQFSRKKVPKRVQACWCEDLDARPSLEEMLFDPFVLSMDMSTVPPEVVAMVAARIAKRQDEEVARLKDEALMRQVEAEVAAQEAARLAGVVGQEGEEVGQESTSSSSSSQATAGSGPTAAGELRASPSPLARRRLPTDTDLHFPHLFSSGLQNSTEALLTNTELLGLSDGDDLMGHFFNVGSLSSLGSGGVASVLLVGPAQGYSGTFALKVVRLSSLVREVGRETVLAMDVQCEFTLLARAALSGTAPIVMQFGWAVVREAGLVVSLMEVAEAGDLKAFQGKLSLDEVCYVARQVLEALQWLLTEGYEHCDVKPENIFLKAGGQVRLGDLNAALSVEASADQRFYRGTPAYMAPEVMHADYDMARDGRADIFSLAKVLHFLATRPASLVDVTQCLHHNPFQRPTISELLTQSCFHYATYPPASFVTKAKLRATDLGLYQPAEPASAFLGSVATGTQDLGLPSFPPSEWALPSQITASLWDQSSSAPSAAWGNTFVSHQAASEDGDLPPAFRAARAIGRGETLSTEGGVEGLGLKEGSLLLSSLFGGKGEDDGEEEEEQQQGRQGSWDLSGDHSRFPFRKDDEDDAGAGGAMGGGASLGGLMSGNAFSQQWCDWGSTQSGSTSWATRGQGRGGSQAQHALGWEMKFGASQGVGVDDGDFLRALTDDLLFKSETLGVMPLALGCEEMFYGSVTNQLVVATPTALYSTHPGDGDCPEIASIQRLGSGAFSAVYLVGPDQGYPGVYALKVSDTRVLNCMLYLEQLKVLQTESHLLALIGRNGGELQSLVVEQVGWSVYWPGGILVNLLAPAVGGSLDNYRNTVQDEDSVRYIVRRLVKALHLLLVDYEMEHCDVKLANALVTQEGQVLLADFNCVLLVSEERFLRVGRGDPAIRAPEIEQEIFVDGYGCRISPANVTADGRADVYSLGKLMSALLTDSAFDNLSDTGKACYSRMMAYEATERPTFEQLLEGDWLSGAPTEPPPSWTVLVDAQVEMGGVADIVDQFHVPL